MGSRIKVKDKKTAKAKAAVAKRKRVLKAKKVLKARPKGKPTKTRRAAKKRATVKKRLKRRTKPIQIEPGGDSSATQWNLPLGEANATIEEDFAESVPHEHHDDDADFDNEFPDDEDEAGYF